MRTLNGSVSSTKAIPLLVKGVLCANYYVAIAIVAAIISALLYAILGPAYPSWISTVFGVAFAWVPMLSDALIVGNLTLLILFLLVRKQMLTLPWKEPFYILGLLCTLPTTILCGLISLFHHSFPEGIP
jgi:hypothetical protein